MESMEKLMSKLRKKSKRTLREERQELLERQGTLAARKRALTETRDSLNDVLIAALTAHDEGTTELTRTKLDDTKARLEETNREIKNNAELLEAYARVLKLDREGKAVNSNAIAGWVTGIGTLGIGALSLGLAYKADQDGSPVRKGVLDVFRGAFSAFRGKH